MRATRGNILVKVKLDQKEKHGIFFMAKNRNEDGKEANNVVCEVIDSGSFDYPYLKTGDILIVHHNFFDRDNERYLIEKGIEEATYVIPARRNEESSHIYAKIVNGEIRAVCDNLICSRVLMPIPETILVVPDSARKNYQDRVVVLSKSPEIEGINIGDTVAIKMYADAELVYNWDGREQRVIKIWGNDIIGIINN